MHGLKILLCFVMTFVAAIGLFLAGWDLFHDQLIMIPWTVGVIAVVYFLFLKVAAWADRPNGQRITGRAGQVVPRVGPHFSAPIRDQASP